MMKNYNPDSLQSKKLNMPIVHTDLGGRLAMAGAFPVSFLRPYKDSRLYKFVVVGPPIKLRIDLTVFSLVLKNLFFSLHHILPKKLSLTGKSQEAQVCGECEEFLRGISYIIGIFKSKYIVPMAKTLKGKFRGQKIFFK